MPRRGDLRQIHRHAAQFHPAENPLHQPAEENQQRCHQPQRVAYPGRHAIESVPHDISPSAEEQRFCGARAGRRTHPAPMRSQRLHQIPRSECGERKHQRREFVSGREEGARDESRVIAVDHEVVHLEEISARDADHSHEFRLSWHRLQPVIYRGTGFSL